MCVRKHWIWSVSLLVCSGCGTKSTDDLIADLNSAQEADRIKAVRLLPDRKRDAAKIVPALIASLQEKDARVRGAAATALGLMGPRAAQAVPALTAALKDPVPGVRLWSAGALGRIGPAAKPAVGALIEGLNDKEFRVAMAMSCALNEIDPEAPTKALLASGGEQEIDQLARDNQALMRRHLEVLKGITDRRERRAVVDDVTDHVHLPEQSPNTHARARCRHDIPSW